MKRNLRIYQAGLALFAVLFLTALSACKNGAHIKQPNIIIITTDQQHARLMSCAGEEFLSTPNMDKLAASGVRFENAYCANPVCVPSRYSMITGYMPHVFDGLESNRKTTNVKPLVNDYITTLPMGWIFRNAGYETVYGGKFHVEGSWGFTQEKEEAFGFTPLSGDAKEILAQDCSGFFKRDHEKPFLMWASFINPHDICKFPFMGYVDMEHPYTQKLHKGLQDLHQQFPDEPLPPLPANFEPTLDDIDWIEHFHQGEIDGTGLNAVFGSHAHTWSNDLWQEYRWAYRRYMEEVDAQIGILLDGLREAGLEENTIIIFTSDHGDHDGAHGLTMKRSFYEESVNIPLIVCGPGVKNRGSVNTSGLINNGIDLIPTLCDYAGIEIPEGLKGESFRGLVEGLDNWKRDYVVSQTNTGRMLRTARYKYNVYFKDGKSGEQLFDMENDRLEKFNLANDARYKEILTEHQDKLKQWLIENRDTNGLRYLAGI